MPATVRGEKVLIFHFNMEMLYHRQTSSCGETGPDVVSAVPCPHCPPQPFSWVDTGSFQGPRRRLWEGLGGRDPRINVQHRSIAKGTSES